MVTWDNVMEYGPTCLQVGLLAMTAYHFWQRNILKGCISLTMCVATFILGW